MAASQSRNESTSLKEQKEFARRQRELDAKKTTKKPEDHHTQLFGRPIKTGRVDNFSNQIDAVLGSYQEAFQSAPDLLSSIGSEFPPGTPKPPPPKDDDDDTPALFPPIKKFDDGHPSYISIRGSSKQGNSEVSHGKENINSDRKGVPSSEAESGGFQRPAPISSSSSNNRRAHPPLGPPSQHNRHQTPNKAKSVERSPQTNSIHRPSNDKQNNVFAKPNGVINGLHQRHKSTEKHDKDKTPRLFVEMPDRHLNHDSRKGVETAEPSVDKIVQEMTCGTPLSGIQTPRKEDRPFSFSTHSTTTRPQQKIEKLDANNKVIPSKKKNSPRKDGESDSSSPEARELEKDLQISTDSEQEEPPKVVVQQTKKKRRISSTGHSKRSRGLLDRSMPASDSSSDSESSSDSDSSSNDEEADVRITTPVQKVDSPSTLSRMNSINSKSPSKQSNVQTRSWKLATFAKKEQFNTQALSQPPIPPGISDEGSNGDSKLEGGFSDNPISEIFGIDAMGMMCLPIDVDQVNSEVIATVADMETSSMYPIDQNRTDEFTLDSPLDCKPDTPQAPPSKKTLGRSPRTSRGRSSRASSTALSPATSVRGRAAGKSPASTGSIRSPRSVGSSIKSPSSGPQSVGSVKSPTTPKDSPAKRSSSSKHSSSSSSRRRRTTSGTSSTSSKTDVKSSPKISVSKSSSSAKPLTKVPSSVHSSKPANHGRHSQRHSQQPRTSSTSSSASSDGSPNKLYKTTCDSKPSRPTHNHNRRGAARKSPKSVPTIYASSSESEQSSSDSDNEDNSYSSASSDDNTMPSMAAKRTVKSESIESMPTSHSALKSNSMQSGQTCVDTIPPRKPPVPCKPGRSSKDRTKSSISCDTSTTTVASAHVADRRTVSKPSVADRKPSSSMDNLEASDNMERFLEDIASPSEHNMLSPIAGKESDSSDSSSDNSSDSDSNDSGSDSDASDVGGTQEKPLSPIRTPPPQLDRISPPDTRPTAATVPSPPLMPRSRVEPVISAVSSTTAPGMHTNKLIVSIPLTLIPHLNQHSNGHHPHHLHQKQASLGFISPPGLDGGSNKNSKHHRSASLLEEEEGEITSDSEDETTLANPSFSDSLPKSADPAAERTETPPPQPMPKTWQKNQVILSQIVGTEHPPLSKQLKKIPKRKPNQMSPTRPDKRQRRNSDGRQEQRGRYDREHTSHVDDREWDRKHPRRNERDLSLDLADRHSNGSSPTTSLHSEPAGRRGGPEHRRSEFRSDRSQRHERGYRDGHERGSRDRHDDSRSGSRSRVRDWDAPADDGLPSDSPTLVNGVEPRAGAHGGSNGDQWAAMISGAGGANSRSPRPLPRGRGFRKPVTIDSPQNAEYYLREACKLKRKADKLSDVKNEKMMTYIRAVTWFIQHSDAMENDPVAEQQKVFSMYKDTLKLLKNTCSKSSEKDRKLTVLVYRIQAILYLKLYSLKKAETAKLKRIQDDNTMAQSSPHYPGGRNGTPSPMSPSPSPAGSIGSVGSVGSTNGLTNGAMGSTMGSTMGSMASPSANTTISHRMYGIMQILIANMSNLTHCHDTWDRGNRMANQHTDFFRDLDQCCGKLTLDSSISDLVQYIRTGLQWLET